MLTTKTLSKGKCSHSQLPLGFITGPIQASVMWFEMCFSYSSICCGKCLHFSSCSLFCDYATCWVFFLNLGINEISEDVYTAVEHSDSEDSEKSDSSDSEYISDDEQKSKNEPSQCLAGWWPRAARFSALSSEAPALISMWNFRICELDNTFIN